VPNALLSWTSDARSPDSSAVTFVGGIARAGEAHIRATPSRGLA